MSFLRETPWGKLRVIDAHVHFFSYNFFSLLVKQKTGLTLDAAAAQLGWEMPGVEPETLAARWIQELDRHGVAGAALIASIPGDHGSVAAAVRAHPDRFLAYAMANPKAGFDAGAFSDVRVACLFPAMHAYSMHDECVTPVFEWARANKRAVFVHCGMLTVGVRVKLGLPSPFDMRFSNPIDLHAVAMRYPDVPIIVPHFGAGYFREALMLTGMCGNVFLDTSSSNEWMTYQGASLDLRQVFHHALEAAGPSRVLFGTDSSFFPRGWQEPVFEAQAKALYELGLNEAHARQVFGENLLRIAGA